MAFEGVNNKDAIWQTFKCESDTKAMHWHDPLLQAFANAILAAHVALPIQWVKIDTTPVPARVEIKFRDGRRWIVRFYARAVDSPIAYDVNSGQLWVRKTEVIRYITPITNTATDLWVDGCDHVDLRPR